MDNWTHHTHSWTSCTGWHMGQLMAECIRQVTDCQSNTLDLMTSSCSALMSASDAVELTDIGRTIKSNTKTHTPVYIWWRQKCTMTIIYNVWSLVCFMNKNNSIVHFTQPWNTVVNSNIDKDTCHVRFEDITYWLSDPMIHTMSPHKHRTEN